MCIRDSKDCPRIGQGDEADAVIGKDTISHFHAVINRENQEFYLEDLNSTNGTFVNNEAVSYTHLDVYKRQLEQSVEHNLDELLVMAESGRYSTNRINSCIGRKMCIRDRLC